MEKRRILARNWWAIALRGLAAIIFGLLALLAPGITLAVLILWFGVYVLIDGIFSIVAAVRAAESGQRWAAPLVEGIAGIVAGVLTFIWPGITALVLLFLIAVWAIVTGVLEIAFAIRLRREIVGEFFLALMGVVSIIFGLVLFSFPGAGAVAVVWIIGIYALLFGFLLLVLSLRLRALLPPDHTHVPV